MQQNLLLHVLLFLVETQKSAKTQKTQELLN